MEVDPLATTQSVSSTLNLPLQRDMFPLTCNVSILFFVAVVCLSFSELPTLVYLFLSMCVRVYTHNVVIYNKGFVLRHKISADYFVYSRNRAVFPRRPGYEATSPSFARMTFAPGRNVT